MSGLLDAVRADGYEDFVGRREYAAPRQQPRLDLLDQQRIVAVDQVAGPSAGLRRRHGLETALAPAGNRKLRRIELTRI